jgi:hypothetical protein
VGERRRAVRQSVSRVNRKEEKEGRSVRREEQGCTLQQGHRDDSSVCGQANKANKQIKQAKEG